jgi:hypothetical protein
MAKSTNISKTKKETQTEIELAKKQFHETMNTIKKEYTSIIEDLEQKNIKKQINELWTDQNES